jgi:hypothetical protein
MESRMTGTIQRAAVIFFVVIMLFLVIEIAPLHFGQQQIPFDQLGPEIKKRLPRILLIALAVAAFLSTRKNKDASRESSENNG